MTIFTIFGGLFLCGWFVCVEKPGKRSTVEETVSEGKVGSGPVTSPFSLVH